MKRTSYRHLLAIFAAAVMGLSLVGCGESSGNGMKFIVGFDAAFPPYGYQDESGEYVGYDLDLAAEVCERNGWELVKQPIDWNSKDMELNSGTISCIWNGFTINGREDDYAWTEPYVDNSQVIVVKENGGIVTFSDLAGKGVAVQTDSSAEAALNEEDNADLKASFRELVIVSDYNNAFLNLDSGAVDAIAMDIGVANYQIASRGGGYTILEEHLSDEQYGVGFAKDNTELRDQVQSTLDEMREDGTFEEISEKWDLENIAVQETQGNQKMSFSEIFQELTDSMLRSVVIFALTLLFSMPLGLLICLARLYAWKPVQWLMKVYISIVRGTPLMLQLLVIYFGKYFIFGLPLTPEYRFWAVILAFSLNYAAYFAEIFRSGIQSIPVGQYEAAKILGYSAPQKFLRIITPQMVKRVLPAVTNESITLVKDTSLAFAISYTELFTETERIAASQTSMLPYLVAAIFYYVFNLLVAGVMSLVEKKMNYYKI